MSLVDIVPSDEERLPMPVLIASFFTWTLLVRWLVRGGGVIIIVQ